MGGRGTDSGKYKKASTILGQYEIGGIRGNSQKVVSFFRSMDETGGIRYEDGKIKVKRDASDKLDAIINPMIDNMTYLNDSGAQDYKAIKDALTGSYSISKMDRSNIADFNQYRKAGNHVRISNKAGNTSLDSKYQELSSRFPHYFGGASNPADQLQEINDTLNSLKPKRVKLDKSTRAQVKQSLKQDIIRHYVAG